MPPCSGSLGSFLALTGVLKWGMQYELLPQLEQKLLKVKFEYLFSINTLTTYENHIQSSCGTGGFFALKCISMNRWIGWFFCSIAQPVLDTSLFKYSWKHQDLYDLSNYWPSFIGSRSLTQCFCRSRSGNREKCVSFSYSYVIESLER